MEKIKKILAANRSEIAIRIFRAAEESGIRTAAIYSKEDRFALHRFKTDESYLVGEGKGPIQAYLDINSIIDIAKKAGVDAIHPGYGFLSENPEFADLCEKNNIIFIGPTPEILSRLGNKTAAKEVADEVIFMDEGMIVEKAATNEFFANPKNDRTKLFLSQIL